MANAKNKVMLHLHLEEQTGRKYLLHDEGLAITNELDLQYSNLSLWESQCQMTFMDNPMWNYNTLLSTMPQPWIKHNGLCEEQVEIKPKLWEVSTTALTSLPLPWSSKHLWQGICGRIIRSTIIMSDISQPTELGWKHITLDPQDLRCKSAAIAAKQTYYMAGFLTSVIFWAGFHWKSRTFNNAVAWQLWVHVQVVEEDLIPQQTDSTEAKTRLMQPSWHN